MFDKDVSHDQNLLCFWRNLGKTFLFRKSDELNFLRNHKIVHVKRLVDCADSDDLTIKVEEFLTEDNFFYLLNVQIDEVQCFLKLDRSF